MTAPPLDRKVDNPFTDLVWPIKVPGFNPTRAQADAIRKEYDTPQVNTNLATGCAIAEAVGRAFHGTYSNRSNGERRMKVEPFEIPGKGMFVLNTSGPPRFIVDKEDNLVVVVSLIHLEHDDPREDVRWRIRWYNENIPRVLTEMAQKHDAGIPYRGVTRTLTFDKAQIVPLKINPDHRGPRNEAKNANSPTSSAPRLHRRPKCVLNLDAIYGAKK